MKLSQSHPAQQRAVPFERRVAGWFSLILFALAMVGQATHTHGLVRAGASLRSASDPTSLELTGSELTADSCPLCVAMSSAQAAGVTTAPLHEAGVQAAVAPGKVHCRTIRPGRVYRSRPPPVS